MIDLETTLDGLVADAPLHRADWDDVVARAGPSGRGRSWNRGRGFAVAAAALAVAAGLVVAIGQLSGGGVSFTDRAMAALGAERYVRVAVEPPYAQFASVVDVASGRARPAVVRTVYWYDSRSARFRVWHYVDGVAVGSGELIPGNPGLAAFLGGYRAALSDGSAEIAGETSHRGRAVKIVRFFPVSAPSPAPSLPGCAACGASYAPGTTVDVAVDSSTYRPVWFRINGTQVVRPATATRPATTVVRYGSIFRIAGIASFATTSARPGRAPELQGQVTDIRAVDAAEAKRRGMLWPAGTIAGLAVRSAHLQQLTSYRDVTGPVTRAGLGLHLVYRAGPRWVEIRESATPQAAYGFTSATLGRQGSLAPPGSMRLSCLSCAFGDVRPTRAGQFRVNGLYVDLTASSRSLLLAAARALSSSR